MRRQRQPDKHPMRTLTTGFLGAFIAIPLMTVLIPLVLFYYLGQIIGIIKRGPL